MQKRVIIFDDDDDLVSVCSYILSKLGYEVHTRNACQDLINTLENIMPSIIFMDNSIGDTGGVHATQTIKSHSSLKTIPVVYFSAHHQIETLAQEAGADTYLQKPFEMQQLQKLLFELNKK